MNFGCNFKGIIIQYAMYNEFYDLDQRLACKAIDPQGARRNQKIHIKGVPLGVRESIYE